MKLLHTCLFLTTAFFLFACEKVSAPSGDRCAPTNQESFTKIYESGYWGKNTLGKGTSGDGSHLSTTEEYRKFLQDFLKERNIKSVVDLGCGDWEFSQAIDWSNITYTGVDIVPSVVEANCKKFQEHNITFICGDATMMDLPEADLLICKDVLQHLLTKDILILKNQFSKYKYCLITNDIKNDCAIFETNSELSQPGDFRPIDMTAAPFNCEGKKVLHYASPGDCEKVKEVVLLEKK